MVTYPRTKPTADKEVARELEFFIMNDSTLYYNKRRPLELNYARKKVSGTYDREKAIKGLIPLVEAGIRRYNIEYGDIGGPVNRATKELAAKYLLQELQPNITDYVRKMRALKKAGKPWTMQGR